MSFIPALISLERLSDFVARKDIPIRDWAFALERLGRAVQNLPGVRLQGLAPDPSGCYACFYVAEACLTSTLEVLGRSLAEATDSCEAREVDQPSDAFPSRAGFQRFLVLAGTAGTLSLAEAIDRNRVVAIPA